MKYVDTIYSSVRLLEYSCFVYRCKKKHYINNIIVYKM